MEIMELKKWGRVWHRVKSRTQKDAWATESEVFDLLFGMVRSVKPENVLEIGTFEGDTAVAMAKALKENGNGHLTTLDIKDYQQENVIEDAGLSDWVKCIKSNPNEYIDTIPSSSVDFIFIDDGHSYPEVIRDLENAHRLIKPYGYILGHDILMVPDVANAFKNFMSRYGKQYESTVISTYDGVFILRRI